jgi:hypothetical protein
MSEDRDLPCVIPIVIGGAKKFASTGVIEAAVSFHISHEGRLEILSPRCDPVQDHAFESLCIVGSCSRRPFLYLSLGESLLSES